MCAIKSLITCAHRFSRFTSSFWVFRTWPELTADRGSNGLYGSWVRSRDPLIRQPETLVSCRVISAVVVQSQGEWCLQLPLRNLRSRSLHSDGVSETPTNVDALILLQAGWGLDQLNVCSESVIDRCVHGVQCTRSRQLWVNCTMDHGRSSQFTNDRLSAPFCRR